MKMYCTKCGCEIDDAAVICPKCGVPTSNYTAAQQQPVAQPAVQQTVQVNVTAPGTGVSPKSRTTALLLCIFLGLIGGHKFYLGRAGMGILYFFTGGLFSIGMIVDLISIIAGSATDNLGRPVTRW